jgi:hypothetical protein
MISRKREVEKAIKAAFEAFAGSALDDVQVSTSRFKQELDNATVQIVCNRQSNDGDLQNYPEFMQVDGAIVCSALITNTAATEIEALEIQAENFIEQDTQTLLNAINAESDTIELTDISPGEYEDGENAELARYIARYNFTANVRDLTDT